jgi:hypothetical protein
MKVYRLINNKLQQHVISLSPYDYGDPYDFVRTTTVFLKDDVHYIINVQQKTYIYYNRQERDEDASVARRYLLDRQLELKKN